MLTVLCGDCAPCQLSEFMFWSCSIFVNSWTWHEISADARGFSFSSRLECSFLFLAWVLRLDLLILYWVEVGKWPSSPCSWFLRKCFVITDAHCGFSRLYYIGWFPSIASLFLFFVVREYWALSVAFSLSITWANHGGVSYCFLLMWCIADWFACSRYCIFQE